jgi:CHAT domain-containing protein/tetratricopeptide (TPR) repeat protein
LTRPSDKHLDDAELDALQSSPDRGMGSGGSSEPSLSEAQRHVATCEYCHRKVQMHRHAQNELFKLRPSGQARRGSDCLEEDRWLSIAGGLLSEAESKERMNHAAQCDHCGPLLKKAVRLLADEATPTEENSLAELASGRDDWRKNMAEKLRTDFHPPEKARESWWKSLAPWPRRAFAFAAVAVAAAAAWVGVQGLRPPNADQLLARAYTERRTLEPRIAGAKYAPIRVERGPGGSNLDKAPSLLKAEALIGENLRQHPNDPAWLDAKARADLLDGNSDAAVKSLQQALEFQPDSPHLLTDLGSAYYMRAESGDRPIDYGNAIESLGKALAKSPDDQVALFNRALACEQMFLYTQAMDDWQHYLRLDPQGDWADEARRKLAEIQEKVKRHADRMAEPLLTPEEFVARMNSSPSETVSLVDSRIERYLDAAMKVWLPAWIASGEKRSPSSEEARRALDALAEILKKQHEDTWLADFLEAQPSEANNAGVRDLVASEEAVSTGVGDAVKPAQQALDYFKGAGNRAGMLRAGFALTKARAFALDFSGCLDTAAATLPAVAPSRYSWIQAQLLIQQADCEAALARFREAIRVNASASAFARGVHYPELELRARNLASYYFVNMGNKDAGLRQLTPGFAEFWQSDGSNGPGEILYASLADFANGAGWPRVEGFAFNELLYGFPAVSRLDQVLWRVFLADALKRTGEFEAANRTLQDASKLLATLPNDKTLALRRAEIMLDESEIQLDQGEAVGVIASLSPYREQFDTDSVGQFQANYFKILGECYLALNQPIDAEKSLLRALEVLENGLKNLRQEADKLEWSRSRGQVYRDLLAVKLQLGTPAEALAWWEWYKGASIRSMAEGSSGVLIGNFHPVADMGLAAAIEPGTARISYVLRRNSIAAFVSREGTTHVRLLPRSANMEGWVRRLLEFCADPSTDLESLNMLGWRLYGVLIAPLEPEIQGATALSIETDGILDKIPFGILHGADGKYLADKFELTFSQGQAYSLRSNRLSSTAISPVTAALIVVAASGADSSMPVLPEAADEAKDVASRFEGATVISAQKATRAEILRALRSARLFHFAGHAVSSPAQSGLVLGADALLSSKDLMSLPLGNLKLAVLSACETANGDEGSFADENSLTRTLAAAGVAQIVASRWRVDSAVTRQLMREFYSDLLSGKSTANSLRAASFAVRSSPEHRHPYYWASFGVFGSS